MGSQRPLTPARIAVRTAAYGGGSLLGLGAAAAGVIALQGNQAKRTIGVRSTSAPYADGRYGRSKGPSRRLTIIGDSMAAGLGADFPKDTIGANLAGLVAQHSGHAVVLNTVAQVGARSKDLEEQVTRALYFRPHVAVIIIGGNDVTHLVRKNVATDFLREAMVRLRAADVQVVMGTCPDLGTVRPFKPPMRWLAQRRSRELATAQAITVAQAGGRAVSLGDLLEAEFRARPGDLFGTDRFHPSTAGYEAVAQVLASSVLAALSRGQVGEVLPTLVEKAVQAPLSEVAAYASAVPGTEVTAERGTGSRRRWRRAKATTTETVAAGYPEPLREAEPL